MTKPLALLAALITTVACGGTTDSAEGLFDGGASSGGRAAGAAGKGSSGSSNLAGASYGGANAGTSAGGTSSAGGGATNGGVSSGGTSSGGVSSGGVSSGGVTNGGVSSGGTSSGGGPSVDPRCPATTPSGACTAEGLKCEYNPNNNCLCASGASVVTFCQQVDPACTGASPQPPPAGAGGVSSKIAVPAHLRCSCASDKWTCVVGI